MTTELYVHRPGQPLPPEPDEEPERAEVRWSEFRKQSLLHARSGPDPRPPVHQVRWQ